MNQETSKPKRIIGYDVARGLAIIGMVVVNFKLVMAGATTDPGWLHAIASLLEGRAAACFVVLAGIGLSLLTRTARINAVIPQRKKRTIIVLRRATFLLVSGYLFCLVWPPDILHFYGVYLVIGSWFLFRSDRALILTASLVTLAFPLMMLFLNYDHGWDWDTLHYQNFWTFAGGLRNLFFNGFHTTIPWVAFLLFGMWAGRRDFTDQKACRRMMLISLVVTVTVETLSWLLINIPLGSSPDPWRESLFGTEMIPPMPQYIVTGSSTAMVVICLCVSWGTRSPRHPILLGLEATGRMALTHYVAHIIVGLGIAEALGFLSDQSLPFAVCYALLYSFLAIVTSRLWLRLYARGPLEWAMRRITDRVTPRVMTMPRKARGTH